MVSVHCSLPFVCRTRCLVCFCGSIPCIFQLQVVFLCTRIFRLAVEECGCFRMPRRCCCWSWSHSRVVGMKWTRARSCFWWHSSSCSWPSLVRENPWSAGEGSLGDYKSTTDRVRLGHGQVPSVVEGRDCCWDLVESLRWGRESGSSKRDPRKRRPSAQFFAKIANPTSDRFLLGLRPRRLVDL